MMTSKGKMPNVHQQCNRQIALYLYNKIKYSKKSNTICKTMGESLRCVVEQRSQTQGDILYEVRAVTACASIFNLLGGSRREVSGVLIMSFVLIWVLVTCLSAFICENSFSCTLKICVVYYVYFIFPFKILEKQLPPPPSQNTMTKNKNVFSLVVLWFEWAVSRQFLLGVSHVMTDRQSPNLQISEGSTGLDIQGDFFIHVSDASPGVTCISFST